MIDNNLKCILFIVIACILKFDIGNAAEVNIDGGYSIVLAVEDSTPEPTDVKDFLFNAEYMLGVFSKVLFDATDGHFYIRNADILVPNGWNLSTEDSTSQSYAEADIRLSSSFSAPYVENANPCGLPGSFIELPLRFLDDPDITPEKFGSPAKALLNQWARYRWGVWDEHGEPGNRNFPYFYKNLGADDWEATSCSNVKLEGIFSDLNNETCEVNGVARPNPECRFRPSNTTNTATTSLLSFHWLESVTHFCNATTHNKAAPNRQNQFCGHQSVQEVMEQTQDYNKVTDKRTTDPPTLELKIVKSSALPALYILLDRGAPTGNENGPRIIAEFIRQLPSQLIESVDLENTVVSVGSFPEENSGSNLKKLTPWLRVGDHRDEIIKAIGYVPLGPVQRNYAVSIEEAAAEIEKIHPSGGAILFVLKTASVQGSFGNLPYEEQLVNSLIRNRIAVFAVELLEPKLKLEPALPVPGNLKEFASKTGGYHLGLTDMDTLDWPLTYFIFNMRDVLSYGPLQPTHEILVHKGRIAPNTMINIPVVLEGVVQFRIFLTLPQTVTPKIFLAGSEVFANITEEWGEQNDVTRRKTYSLNLNRTEGNELAIEFTCDECTAMGNLVGTATKMVADNDSITVSVITSAVDNVVDFANLQSELSPFTIFAKIEQNGKPVKDLLVTASVIKAENESFVTLLDNGLQNPDLFINDGIYSGIFFPPSDGAYYISVRVHHKILKTNLPNFDRKENFEDEDEEVMISPMLLPVDQTEIADREAVRLEKEYIQFADYLAQVTFSNVANYTSLKDKPMKINNLFAVVDISDKNKVKLTFSSPGLMSGVGKATRYIVQGARFVDTLINKTPETRELITITDVKEPDLEETIIVQNFEPPHDLIYFQVRAINDDAADSAKNAQNSIIVQVRPASDDPMLPETTPMGTATNPTDQITEPDEAFFKTAGGIVVLVLIVLVIIGATGGSFYWFKKKREKRMNSSKTSTRPIV